MDPNQAPTPNQPFDPTQYDFITNPTAPPKKSLIPKVGGDGGGNSGGKSRLLIMIVAGLGIVTVFILLFGLIFRSGSSSSEQILSVAREQSRILIVADIGIQKGGSTDTKSLANSVKLTVQTDQNALVGHLAKNGTKVKDKDIAGAPSAETTEQLTIAEQNGTFDVAFESIMKELLAGYQSDVQAAHEASQSKSAKEIFSLTFDNAALLLKDAENNK